MENENVRAAIARQGTPFLTQKQAANYLCLSPRTLECMRFEGRGPHFRKHGRFVRYHIDDLETWSNGRSLQKTQGEGSQKR